MQFVSPFVKISRQVGTSCAISVSLCLLTLLLGLSLSVSAQQTFPVNGVADQKHIYYAFTHANIYVDSKTTIDSATLLIQDDKIIGAGVDFFIPPEAVVYDLHGKYIYPSFIDMFTDYGIPEMKREKNDGYPQMLSNKKGAYDWNLAIHPETNASEIFTADNKKAEELRKLGFGSVMSLVRDGIARGASVFVSLGEGKENDLIIRKDVAANYSFDKGSSSQNYPESLMGAIALLRQTYLDADWYKSLGQDKEFNLSLDAFNKLQELPQIFEVGEKWSVLRADKIAKEFQKNYIIKGKGDEYQRAKEIAETHSSLIIPIAFPEAYDVDDPLDAMNIDLNDLKHWELAPKNPALLSAAGITFALTTADLKSKDEFRKNILKAIQFGLTPQQALQSLTEIPAEILHLKDKVGRLKNGMLANFIITSKPVFDKESSILENWVQGKRFAINNIERKDLRGNYKLKISGMDTVKLKIAGELYAPSLSLDQDTLKSAVDFKRTGDQFSMKFELKKSNQKGFYRLNGYIDPQNKQILNGIGQTPEGDEITWSASWYENFKQEIKKDTLKDKIKEELNTGDILYPNMGFGWKEIPKTTNILIHNATVWTNEKEGILQNADVLLSDGKIVAVGKNVDTSSKRIFNVQVIDGTGKHLTAGIIDEHSHIAIYGDVNEGTQSVTSEVRIGDVVYPEDINIYRQLAGGVTSSHLLHGSANAIGGQTQLVKLRWGRTAEEMKFAGWDPFIKFALGENVKQSNWGDKQVVRFPQTRMGVEQVYVDAFTRARDYDKKWKDYEHVKGLLKGTAVPPRKDLELDALLDILNSKMFITCHSYQQGEINMLMHVADTFGFHVNTFTHILEGYKVADKMKRHGAGGSSFSDWWAYKYEVVEAIPYNGAIMNKMGITVAYNSDDAEMGRRLNQEAAKAVKYGGISEEEAMKFVTLNPAKLLHVDKQTGSILVGKDADVVLWNDNPLSIYARVEKTFIDGICYYDLNRDKIMQNEIRKERARLIQKMIAAKAKGEPTQKAPRSRYKVYDCEGIHEYEKN